jgi:hypothetical protein
LKKPDINPLTQDSSQQPAVANTVTDIQVEWNAVNFSNERSLASQKIFLFMG